jgi:hypothetical protein
MCYGIAQLVDYYLRWKTNPQSLECLQKLGSCDSGGSSCGSCGRVFGSESKYFSLSMYFAIYELSDKPTLDCHP